MAVWHNILDPFVSILPTTTSAILPLLLSVPGTKPSIHIAVYLPPSGRDREFVLALADLGCTISSFIEQYPGIPFYIQEDGNVSHTN